MKTFRIEFDTTAMLLLVVLLALTALPGCTTTPANVTAASSSQISTNCGPGNLWLTFQPSFHLINSIQNLIEPQIKAECDQTGPSGESTASTNWMILNSTDALHPYIGPPSNITDWNDSQTDDVGINTNTVNMQLILSCTGGNSAGSGKITLQATYNLIKEGDGFEIIAPVSTPQVVTNGGYLENEDIQDIFYDTHDSVPPPPSSAPSLLGPMYKWSMPVTFTMTP